MRDGITKLLAAALVSSFGTAGDRGDRLGARAGGAGPAGDHQDRAGHRAGAAVRLRRPGDRAVAAARDRRGWRAPGCRRCWRCCCGRSCGRCASRCSPSSGRSAFSLKGEFGDELVKPFVTVAALWVAFKAPQLLARQAMLAGLAPSLGGGLARTMVYGRGAVNAGQRRGAAAAGRRGRLGPLRRARRRRGRRGGQGGGELSAGGQRHLQAPRGQDRRRAVLARPVGPAAGRRLWPGWCSGSTCRRCRRCRPSSSPACCPGCRWPPPTARWGSSSR